MASTREASKARSVGRSGQAGLLLAAAAAAKSFERTLMPRKTNDQGIVTGLSVALAYATGTIFQDVIENVTDFIMRRNGELPEDRLRQGTMLADLAAIGGGFMLSRQLTQQERESLGRAGMRTTGTLMSLAGVAGFSVGFVQNLLDVLDPREERVTSNRTLGVALLGGGAMAAFVEYRRRRSERMFKDEEDAARFFTPEDKVQAGKSLLAAGGVTGVLLMLAAGERAMGAVTGRALEQGLAGNARVWRLAGHLGALAALGSVVYAGLDRVYQDIEAGTGKIEPAFDKPPESPNVSGSSESLVAWRTMGREGRRHVITALRQDTISEVMQTEAVVDPIRIFVGLESARNENDRVALAMKELHRTNAFDRDLLVAVSPTGTGYVNYVAIESCEYMTLGNCATVTLQYSKRPSPLSMDRVREGRLQFRMLLAAIRREMYTRDPDARPRLVVFGESLGAHTSQDAFLHQGTQGLEDAGVERALWIGSPHLSKWKAQVFGVERPDVDATRVIDVNGYEDLEQLPGEARSALRYVMITHHNDGVGLFGADLVIQKPGWLGEADLRPPAVPKWMRWTPIVTASQVAIDMKNAMNVVPGEFVANGHDYRADLARFVREVYGLQCTDSQLERIEEALRKYEVVRQQMLDQEKPAEPPREQRAINFGPVHLKVPA